MFVAKWWGKLLGYDEERKWIEIKERRTVPLAEVREALAEAALTRDDLVAGGIKKTTALELTSATVARRPRSGEHVVTAKTVERINSIIARLDRPADPIPLIVE